MTRRHVLPGFGLTMGFTLLYMELPEQAHPEATTALVYIRPHLLDIDHQPNGANSFRARVEYINLAGPVVKVQLVSEWGNPVSVEISQERYRLLRLEKDAEVFVTPRDQKIFVDTYAI